MFRVVARVISRVHGRKVACNGEPAHYDETVMMLWSVS
jgi:hypothetical protein